MLTLDDFVFAEFEVPARISFGGRQMLVVHRLPGGGRVTDVMGDDAADITWSGVMSGAGACPRARQLDAMRVAGAVRTLSWNGFSRQVVIAALELEFRNPWWVPYRIACSVAAMAPPSSVGTVLDAILADATAAGAFVDVTAVTAAFGEAGALTPGTSGYAAAGTALAQASGQVSAGLAGAESAMASNDLGALTSAAGQLAQYSAAQGFLDSARFGFGQPEA